MKRNPLGNGTKFTDDLGHQLLIDQSWRDTEGWGSDLDEYVWLDGRPVMVFRGKVNGTGVHLTETPGAPPVVQCNHDDGEDVHCGAFHLATNLQSYPMLALSDYDGKVANFALPDVDGVSNQPRFVQFGGQGTADPQKFDVPVTFSKQARFRALYTGGSNSYWGWLPGVDSFRLTATSGAFTEYFVYGNELSGFWSGWSPEATGSELVTWSTTCSISCSSAADMLEWRVWETGAPKFSTRLRFPGQFQDNETDFFENWNRYYDPTMGRYLSPEPLLQSPDWVSSQLRSGRQVPSYSYALNNPVRNVDRDGLRVQLMDAEAFRIAADPRIHGLLRWLDSSPDTYRLYGDVSLRHGSGGAFGQFFPGLRYFRMFAPMVLNGPTDTVGFR